MQIDVGFADAITPGPIPVIYPTLLQMPAPELRGYNRETVIAEKAHAMIELGSVNTRMKDFFDLWTLARQFDFECALLAAAIRRTFEQRGTPIPEELPAELIQQFAVDKQAQWQAFLRRNQLTEAPADLGEVIRVLGVLLSLPLQAAFRPQPIAAHWRAGFGWDQANV
jgi:hypothetical protein